MGYKEATLTFHEDKITYIGSPLEGLGDPEVEADFPEQELEVMMRWETPIMEKSAAFVCENGGDILEIGFGMGIASDAIQSHQPTTHTIIELHPQIAQKAREWAEGKAGVTIVEGDWIEVLDSLGKFDGIFYDTYGFFGHWDKFAEFAVPHANPGCHITFWNCSRGETNGCGFDDSYNIDYEEIPVDPPQNTYFNDSVYYFPKVII
tara:strand:- start:164 stop:781 length:618 start_codon:yes stop_codon:yes gene_type:complete